MTLNPNISTPTAFELIFKVPRSVGEQTDELKLKLFGTVIPALDIAAEIDLQWQGHKAGTDPGGGVIFGDWTLSYFVTSDFSNWHTLYKWMLFTARGDLQHHSFNATLVCKDNFGNPVLYVDFFGTWIKSVGEVTLNTQSGEEFLQSTLSLSYNEFRPRLPGEQITSELPDGHVL